MSSFSSAPSPASVQSKNIPAQQQMAKVTNRLPLWLLHRSVFYPCRSCWGSDPQFCDPSMHVLTPTRSQSHLMAPEFSSLTGERGEQSFSRCGLNHSMSPKGRHERTPTHCQCCLGTQAVVNCYLANLFILCPHGRRSSVRVLQNSVFPAGLALARLGNRKPDVEK